MKTKWWSIRSSNSIHPVLWADYANLLWGAWLISNAFSYNYESTALQRSDLASGALVVFYSSIRFIGGASHFSWATCLVGLWLLIAPLLFWARSPAVYSNDTLLGCLIIACGAWAASASQVTPGTQEIPGAWSYNPSTWSQRIPIIGLAFVGFFCARHLAAFQLGHIGSVWEPFFGTGTERILKSDVSKAFPVSDAGLGAFSYLLDALAGAIGDQRRWRTMPWMVVLFGLMIIPPGITSITLIILQPVAVGAWCSLCLFTALVMLLMVPPALDEVVASIQFLISSKRQGKPFWVTFWKGEQLDANAPVEVPTYSGSRAPWHLIASAAIGVWLMIAPTTLGLAGISADNLYFVAALVVTFSIIATSEVGRPLRYINILLSIWLLATAVVLPDTPPFAQVMNGITAIILALLNLPLGPIRYTYGSYDRWIRWKPFRRSKNEPQTPRQAA